MPIAVVFLLDRRLGLFHTPSMVKADQFWQAYILGLVFIDYKISNLIKLRNHLLSRFYISCKELLISHADVS